MLTPRGRRSDTAQKKHVSWGDEVVSPLRKTSGVYGGWGLLDTKIIPNLDELLALNNYEPLGYLFPQMQGTAELAQEKRRWMKQRKNAQIESLRTKSQSQAWRIPKNLELPRSVVDVREKAFENSNLFSNAKAPIEIPQVKTNEPPKDATIDDDYDPAIILEDEEVKRKRSRWGGTEDTHMKSTQATNTTTATTTKKSRWESSAPPSKPASRWGSTDTNATSVSPVPSVQDALSSQPSLRTISAAEGSGSAANGGWQGQRPLNPVVDTRPHSFPTEPDRRWGHPGQEHLHGNGMWSQAPPPPAFPHQQPFYEVKNPSHWNNVPVQGYHGPPHAFFNGPPPPGGPPPMPPGMMYPPPSHASFPPPQHPYSMPIHRPY